MSGGHQTLMRTRCPECGTVFRVTSEQLRVKAGKVRCGQCQAVFNAFDYWQADEQDSLPAAEYQAADVSVREAHVDPVVDAPVIDDEAHLAEPSESQVVGAPDTPVVDETGGGLPVSDESGDERTHDPEQYGDDGYAILAAESTLIKAESEVETVAGQEADNREDGAGGEGRDQTPEETTLAAREAGLVAARELSDSAGFNRWAAGTLAVDDSAGFATEATRSAVWPYVIFLLLLSLSLLAQLAYHFRTELVLRLPSLVAVYESAGIEIPLPRDPAFVSIESSDLQSDNARGLFVMQATLKNRAAYAQAWPALELSLTDTNDAVVLRRVIYAAEYLPPGTQSDAFPANAEVAVRLWVEARDVGAAGYRLYIFYP